MAHLDRQQIFIIQALGDSFRYPVHLDERPYWVDGTRPSLEKDGWNVIVTTAELELDAEQNDVGMAVDIEFACKPAVFIGDGWSSFASDIVHRRIVDGKDPSSIRFF
ncbi:hypothetical protein BDZ97DRAFT_1931261 [Flammula alnicola]|nr:hypothetical protein BDZ97DRAFT_1931261 [Flammula alnicola]